MKQSVFSWVIHRGEDAFGKYELPLLQFRKINETGMVSHCFTTRLGGVSEGMFASLNLSFTRGDEERKVAANYGRIADFLGITLDQIVTSDQTHTTNVIRVGKADGGNGVTKPRPYTDVDGLITDEPGVALATFYADCVPLYFVDPVHRAIGLSHSGWRGTVERMGKCTVEAMHREFGTEPAHVIAAIGPSICGACYEVGEDVAVPFSKAFEGMEEEILAEKGPDGDGNPKYLLNLWRANEIVLREAGILPENIITTDICTCCNPQLLFSHRASCGKRGNLGAFLMIRP